MRDDDPLFPRDTVFFAALEDGELVGYCCFGAQARVGAMRELPGVLDVGWALRPDLVGRGRGKRFVEATLELGRRRFRPRRFRIAVLYWNERSRRAASSAGFRRSGRALGGKYIVMTRPARRF